MRPSAVVVSLVVLLVAFGVTITQARADEFYEVGQNDAIYIAWTQDSSGHLQGQVEVVSIDPNDSTRLKTTNSAFTGTRSGSDISLTFGLVSAFSGETWTGHISWGKLSLVIPTSDVPQRLTLKSGSFDQFNQGVSGLKDSVTTNAARAAEVSRANQQRVSLLNAVEEAAGHVQDGGTSIDSGLSNLREMVAKSPDGGLREQYAQEWQKMEAVWQKEQSEGQVIPMTCYQKSQVEYEASQVDYELSQFNYLDSQVEYTKGLYNGAMSNVVNGIAEATLWAPLVDERARSFSQSVGRAYNHSVVSLTAPKISSARKSLKYFAARWDDFMTYVNGYDKRAKQQDDDAKAFPSSITCSD